MKTEALSPDDREKEALHWATNFCHDLRFELTPEGSRDVAYDAQDLIGMYDDRHKDQKFFDDHMARYFRVALSGEGYADVAIFNLCSLAAALIERGEPLPKYLRNFTVKFLLRDPIFETTGKPGRTHGDLLHRDICISEAIEHIVKTWEFQPTRNEATTTPSAASIVRNALEKGAEVHLSEKAINNIWSAGYQHLPATNPY